MPDLQAGAALGHYRILRKLGSGGMADVYEAEDQKLGRRVALKILPPELERNPGLIARFEVEVRAAARLSHRNIVTVFEVGHEGGYHFYSMRLLSGGDLRERINQGALAPAEAIAILREVTEAFVEAHAHGFVHRDMKPENIMFDERGMPVLTDFGIAKVLGSSTGATTAGGVIGTPRYMSPEQARAKPVDARTDLYSLGIVLYEMLTGAPPFQNEEAIAIILQHVSEPMPRLPAALTMLQPLLDKMTAKEPADRPASAQELLELIDALPTLPTVPTQSAEALKQARAATARRTLQDSAGRVPTLPQAPPAIEGAPRRRKLALPLAAALALAIVAALGLWRYQASRQPDIVAASAAPTIATPPPASPTMIEPPKGPAVPVEEPPVNEPPAKEPPSKEPPAKEPPVPDPPVKEPPPKEPPPGAVRKPERSNQANSETASKMVLEGRAAFRRKEYKSSISYANSALMLDPANVEAKKLLRDAQQAREQAMKGISVD